MPHRSETRGDRWTHAHHSGPWMKWMKSRVCARVWAVANYGALRHIQNRLAQCAFDRRRCVPWQYVLYYTSAHLFLHALCIAFDYFAHLNSSSSSGHHLMALSASLHLFLRSVLYGPVSVSVYDPCRRPHRTRTQPHMHIECAWHCGVCVWAPTTVHYKV